MDLGEVLWAMVALFFWVMFFWMFITVFGDIFRRSDLSGWGKAGWVALIFVLPLIGLLIYMVLRPRMTEQELQAFQPPQQRSAPSYSPADEVAKLAQLREAGDLTAEEYERLKSSALTRA
ncbi:MAG: SHOCT domain-containing protein [Actinomycetes bacterium]